MFFPCFFATARYLKIASHGPFRLSASLKPEQLSKCVQLEELFLGGDGMDQDGLMGLSEKGGHPRMGLL